MAIDIENSVLDRLEQADPDRVRSAKLADPDQRGQLLTLYAFHMELAKVPELVSDPMAGRIRYQWWRDCVAEIYGDSPVRRHEVATPLAELVEQTKLSRFHLDRIIDGRERDLDPRPFESLQTAIDYADATSGALARAACTIFESDRGLYCGRAWGLTGLARGYRYYADTMLKAISFDDILTAAEDAYREATGISRGETLPAVGYVALVPGFIKRMRKSGYDGMSDVPDYSAFRKQIRMLGAVARGSV